jgi:transposase
MWPRSDWTAGAGTGRGQPRLDGVVATMVTVRDSLLKQITVFDRAIRRLAKTDDTARRLMTVPGVGAVVALAYMSVIDDPKRFGHAHDVGADLGLNPQRYQSGELDPTARISKCGDGFVRTCLFEAAGVLLTRTKHWSWLKAWGVRLMRRVGAKKAKVAVARKPHDAQRPSKSQEEHSAFACLIRIVQSETRKSRRVANSVRPSGEPATAAALI